MVGNPPAPVIARTLGRRATLAGILLVGGAGLAGLAAFPTVPTAAAGLFAVGVAGSVWNVTAVSLRQELVPPHVYGRVVGVYRLMTVGAVPVGALSGGIVARYVGIRWTFGLDALTEILLGAILMAYFRRLAVADNA